MADILFILYLFYIVSLIRYISFIYVVRCTLYVTFHLFSYLLRKAGENNEISESLIEPLFVHRRKNYP